MDKVVKLCTNNRGSFLLKNCGVHRWFLWILVGVLLPFNLSLAATWDWDGGAGNNNWNTANNWVTNTRPVSANTTILNFGNNTRSTANNNFAGTFTLNQLDFQGSLTGAFSVTGNALSFAGTTPQINMDANFNTSISNAITLATGTSFLGTGSGTATLSGVISGANTATFGSGNYALTNAANSFSGGFSQTGGVVTVRPTAANTAITIANTGNSYLGAGTISVTGGTLNLTPTGTGALTLNRSMTVGPGTANLTTTSGALTIGSTSTVTLNNGGTFNAQTTTTGNIAVNGDISASGATANVNLNSAAGLIMNAGSTITLNNAATATLTGATGNFTATPTYTFGTGGGTLNFAIQSGLSDAGGIGNIVVNTTGTNQAVVRNTVYNNDAAAGGWASTFNNTSPYMTVVDGSISGTGNLTMSAINGALVYYGQLNYGGTLTFSGVAGGNAEANSTATDVGRFALAGNIFTATGGFVFQNANQVLTFGGPSTLASNITIASGETDFSGRDTQVVYPPTANRLTVGGGAVNSTTLTINNGATATFDLGFRDDTYAQAFGGVNLNASTIINAGGTLQFTQSVYNPSNTYDNVVVNGNITSQGTEATGESTVVLQNSIGGVTTTDTGSRNIVISTTTKLYVQGSGIDGLTVQGSSTNVNNMLTSNMLQTRVLSVGSPTTDQGTLTIAYTDAGSRTFTASDGPAVGSYIKLGFGGNGTYTLNNSTGSGGSLANWNGLVIKGGTVDMASNIAFTGAGSGGGNETTFVVVAGTLNLTNGSATFTGGADVRSGSITGGAGAGAGTLTVGADIVKTTSATVTIAGKVATSASSATINIQGGTILLGASNVIGNNINVNLNGSGATFATGGHSDTLGTLTLSSTGTLDVGGGASIMNFADSSATTWIASQQLIIQNWTGTFGTGGGTDQIIFGNSITGLTSAQVAQIRFYNPNGLGGWWGAMILPSGEVVPFPEPSTYFSGIGLVIAGALYEMHRRRKQTSS